MQQIGYGTAKKLRKYKGAVYQFHCNDGAVLSGSPTVFCNRYRWNDTAPTCLSMYCVFGDGAAGTIFFPSFAPLSRGISFVAELIGHEPIVFLFRYWTHFLSPLLTLLTTIDPEFKVRLVNLL